MRHRRLLSFVAILILATGAAAGSESGICVDPGRAPDGEVVRLESIRLAGCNVIDFEGLSNGQPIGLVTGVPSATFGPSWLAVIDTDAGGTGNIANEPSPSTIAFFLDDLDPIDFSEGVQYVEIYYSASAISLPVAFTGWDGPGGTGSVVATALGNTVGSSDDGAPCTGDPEGPYCLWDTIAIDSPTANIMSITLDGAVANYFGFDNMTFCTDMPAAGACCQPSGACAVTIEANCLSMGGTYLGDGSVCLGDANGNGADDACEAVPVPAFRTWVTVFLGILVLLSGAVLIRRIRL